MHLANFMADPGIIKDSLGSSGFAGINVGHDTNIPQVL
jgi:hypothetical protein